MQLLQRPRISATFGKPPSMACMLATAALRQASDSIHRMPQTPGRALVDPHSLGSSMKPLGSIRRRSLLRRGGRVLVRPSSLASDSTQASLCGPCELENARMNNALCLLIQPCTAGQPQSAIPHAAGTQHHQETAGPEPADGDFPPSDLPADEGDNRFDGPHPGLWQGIAWRWRLACLTLRSSVVLTCQAWQTLLKQCAKCASRCRANPAAQSADACM